MDWTGVILVIWLYHMFFAPDECKCKCRETRCECKRSLV